ncbi:hypothetical protein [Paenibacillus rigui]|uniref:Uncharacterized protein n=1 Tax=Paenibacillus rigui TaxID=554312 RepID=A0A229UUW2_9BACL|nr:hypothetical protein [Paenibacillus rigui]OXM87397.1 hypothetical protein CF651_04635 [Paenibacillus rigui]
MFKIELRTIIPIENVYVESSEERVYDQDLDDGRSVIADICKIFGSTNKIVFYVSGFGQDIWPVDCTFDLPVIVEQLPSIIKKIKQGDFNFELDFYEQGIESTIDFIDQRDNVLVVCKSRSNWKPDPINLQMEKDDVKSLILALKNKFFEFGMELCPDLINNQLLLDWMEE